ncbi:MAG TPA: 50S ribosomal protein L29 [bacterium]|nr:50S ribosomal protein L29 [bacterium]HPR88516.1 50S ribosomal protein L29 [bacterium]
MNKNEELRKLSLKEIQIQLEDALVEMENLRIQHSTRQLDNPLRIRAVRRNIARMRTIINEMSGAAQA